MRLLPAAFVLAFTAPLGALTVQPLSFAQLVDESSVVVYGRVSDVRGQWTADRQGIESVLTIEVFDRFKGAIGDTAYVRLPGGQVGHLVNVLPGAPVLAAGDRVVLFLKTNGPSIPIVTGTTQGVFRVTADARTGAPVVTPPLVEGAAGRVTRGDPSRRPSSLEAFGAAVRAAGPAR
jgi:hypothetical protein